ncbi:MAG: substrate-binding domain-containing protein [Streptosporangiales bacterium]|nr:substrate-binding domain-containing protein [Streptosporangiales bacterium]
MRPRTTRLLVALLAVVVAAVGCGRGGDGESSVRHQEEIVIGWTPGDITGVYKTATEFFQAGAEDANKHGFNVEVLSRAPSAHTAFAEQVAIIEDFVSQNVDVIAISPVDVEAIKPAIRRANEAGIPVILVNLLENQPDVEIASYIGFDNADAAAVSAYSILDYFGGPGVLGSGPKVDVQPDTYLDRKWWEKTYENVDKEQSQASGAIIEGVAGTLFSQERLNGFHSVADSYPGIKLQGAPIAADWNREKGVKATETLLSRFGADGLDFIWAASNEMGLGAMLTAERKAVLATGTTAPPGKVAVFTNDVTPESVNAIKAGKIVAETHHGFAEWGWFGTQVGVQLACGQDVPKQVDIRPRTVWKGNAQLFYPDIELPPIKWDQIKANCR